MYSLVNLGNIILLVILLLIFYSHYQYYSIVTHKFAKIIVILSFLIFVIIFSQHMIYVKKNEDKHAENYLKFINSKININNMAVKLVMDISLHPIFHLY